MQTLAFDRGVVPFRAEGRFCLNNNLLLFFLFKENKKKKKKETNGKEERRRKSDTCTVVRCRQPPPRPPSGLFLHDFCPANNSGRATFLFDEVLPRRTKFYGLLEQSSSCVCLRAEPCLWFFCDSAGGIGSSHGVHNKSCPSSVTYTAFILIGSVILQLVPRPQ